jgi:hypothetical protein
MLIGGTRAVHGDLTALALRVLCFAYVDYE